ncbi:MAG TPA: decaprenyl-phosphate phosphoribosyltransferase [Chloroflexia bacterium]|nr:decaprenyl-phosphate phosphoribosyltransferase [Chloroflexia bacterium]
MKTTTPPEKTAPISSNNGRSTEELSESTRNQLLPIVLLKAMRPKQWTKNVLLFGALLFALKFTDWESVWRALAGFGLFCLFSSSVYIINDLRDREKDRLNPRTAKRPIASGALKPSVAVATVCVILPLTFVLSYMLSPGFAIVGAIYMAKDFGYSFGLKHLVIIDVMLIAAGFTLRAVAGALAINVDISPWLYVVTTLGALFLGLNKRKHEVLLLGADASSHRKVLDEYSPALIEEMLAVITASTLMSYTFYTFTADNLPIELQKNHLMMLTIPFVLYGIFRYLYLVYQKDQGSSPEEVLLKDRPLLICVVLWAVTAATLLYVYH